MNAKMYKITHCNNQIGIQEYFRRPIVYLDHWALNDLSLDPDLRNRFIKLMNEKGGTFRLSIVNINELSIQGNKSQVESILDMIESINDCGLINIDSGEVIRKEDALVSDPSLPNPSAELDIIAAYLRNHNYPGKWHVAEIIRNIIPDLPSEHMNRNSAIFLDDMQKLLGVGRADDKHLKRASNRFRTLKTKGPKYPIATRELLQMALDFVLKNRNMKMNKYSEWSDLFHVIVPVAYCDAVLIDRKWNTFIAQTGFSHPTIAKIFDRRSLENFFQAIDNWGN